jgi:hypothetical protein
MQVHREVYKLSSLQRTAAPCPVSPDAFKVLAVAAPLCTDCLFPNPAPATCACVHSVKAYVAAMSAAHAKDSFHSDMRAHVCRHHLLYGMQCAHAPLACRAGLGQRMRVAPGRAGRRCHAAGARLPAGLHREPARRAHGRARRQLRLPGPGARSCKHGCRHCRQPSRPWDGSLLLCRGLQTVRQHGWCRQGASKAASKCASVHLLLLVAWRATARAAHTAHAGQGMRTV